MKLPVGGWCVLAPTLTLAPYILALPTDICDKDFQKRCSDLAQTFRPDNVEVLISEFLPKGTNWTDIPITHPSCVYTRTGAIFQSDGCRLKLNISTSATSKVITEIILPVDWKEKGKRIATHGNGGLGGCVDFGGLAYTSSLGFVSVATNNGHDGNVGVYFLNNPEVLKDFVYRSIVVATEVAKKAALSFYGEPNKKSYYTGCSTGGRQGLKAAQDFPDLFDGILAGAAASDFLDLVGAGGRLYGLVGRNNTSSYLNAEQWKWVHESILKQCDGIDGVIDGVIEDPMKCKPRFESLACEGSGKCLSTTQVAALNQVYQPFYGLNGELLYPRMQPGAEIAFGEALITFGPNMIVDWFRYVVTNDSTWDFDRDWNLENFGPMKAQDPFGVSTWNPDLSKLRKTGHKLITYHGLMDESITSENSYRYYDYVSKTMRLSPNKLDEFYRFFPISGLSHCGSGDGAWYIGGAGQPGLAKSITGQQFDPKGGVLMDLVRWVENGIAPQTLAGRSIRPGSKESQMVKSHCKYPLKNKYVGSGDPNLGESWRCE
ncbi:Tannase and feruloyl esterase [Orbilia ellipsospora]|uniref:Carboxylic ester hydrolase n=1 Tax=Orbilia ellipsospora TaxID=2528407 RepID=A0AAV9WR91_9PEZI